MALSNFSVSAKKCLRSQKIHRRQFRNLLQTLQANLKIAKIIASNAQRGTVGLAIKKTLAPDGF
jgi:hypothetical protein